MNSKSVRRVGALALSVMLSAVVLSATPAAYAASGSPAKAKVTKEVGIMVKQLDDLQKRYQGSAVRYAERAKRADDPTAYEKASEIFTMLAAKTASLRAEASKVRTTAELSKIRAKKVKLHLAAAAAYKKVLAILKPSVTATATPTTSGSPTPTP